MAVGAQVIRVQAAFWVIDAVPCFLFWRGIREAAHVRPPTIGFSGERAPPHAPWVLQFELWRHDGTTRIRPGFLGCIEL